MIGWAAVTYEPEGLDEEPRTTDLADVGSSKSTDQPAAPSTTGSMSPSMPPAPAEIGKREDRRPIAASGGIEPEIAKPDVAEDQAPMAEAEPATSIQPDIAADDSAAAKPAASGGGGSVQPEIAVADSAATKMAAKPAPAPGIAPDIASDDNVDSGAEDRASAEDANAEMAPKMAPAIAAAETEDPKSTAATTTDSPAMAKGPPEKTQMAAAAVKPDIASDKPTQAKPDIASDTSAAAQSSGSNIARDIATDDEPTETAALAPDIAPDDIKEEASQTTESTTESTPPTNDRSGKVVMAPVPDPAIITDTPKGPLPVISADGRQAWRVYARPFRDDNPDKTLIAIILGGMGMSQSATNAAIQQLPGEVTLSFAAYAPDLPKWISGARAAGHEVMLQLPMEPLSYPANDPGPHTLLTSLSPAENIDRMEWLLSRFAGYVGVTSFMGSKFTTSPDHLRPILTELKQRGLLFLDTGATRDSVAARLGVEMGLPIAVSDRFVDRRASRVAIDAQLLELEQIARRGSIAVGIGYPFPVTIERLAAWIPSLAQKGIELAPISAIVDRIHRSQRRRTTKAATTAG